MDTLPREEFSLHGSALVKARRICIQQETIMFRILGSGNWFRGFIVIGFISAETVDYRTVPERVLNSQGYEGIQWQS